MEKIIYVTEEIAKTLPPHTLVTVEKSNTAVSPVPGESITWLTDKQVAELEEKLGYEFFNKTLLTQAFTHSSCRPSQSESDAMDNEALEFIGDRSLDLIITKKLIEQYTVRRVTEETFDPNDYGFDPLSVKVDEGELTKIKIQLVNSMALSAQTTKLGLHNYLITGDTDKDGRLKEENSVREDLFEAVIGAVTVDSGWNMLEVEAVLDRIYNIKDMLNDLPQSTNYIGLLQEYLQKNYGVMPDYDISEEYEGESRFMCTLRIPRRIFPDKLPLGANDDGENVAFIGSGSTKQEARMAAAESAYGTLVNEISVVDAMINAVGTPTVERAVNQLQELWQKQLISSPEYTFGHTDAFTDAEWECTCQIPEKEQYTVIAANKPTAKKHAAYFALCSILGREPDGLDFSTNGDIIDYVEYQRRISEIEQAIERNIIEAHYIENIIRLLEKEKSDILDKIEDCCMDRQNLENTDPLDPEHEAEIKRDIKKCNQTIDALSKEYNNKEQRIKTEKALLSFTRSRISKLDSRLKETLAVVTQVTRELRDELTELVLEKERIKKEFLYVQDIIHTLTNDLEATRVAIEKNGVSIENSQEIIQNLEKQIVNETAQKDVLSCILTELDEKIKELQTQINNLITRTSEFTAAVGVPTVERAVNQLQELWQKGFIAQPEYTSEETVTDVSAWTFTCRIPGMVEAIGNASTKQAAKKQAAYNAYCALIGR